MTIEEAFDLGFIEQSDLDFFKKIKRTKFICSWEFMQDLLWYRKTLFAVRGGPIDPALAEEWKRLWKLLQNFDFDAAVSKYKVDFVRNEWDKVEYQELDWKEKM
jgi:hypothetical protein